jgi:type IX secretion system PorP/SprF family membrane protein
MMKKLYYLFLILAVSKFTFAQQQGVYSNFMMNSYYYNPAIAGSLPNHVINLGVRKQWTGFQGAPFLVNANFHGSYKNRGKVGYGASFISESMGITNRFGVYVNYAQHFRLFKDVKLGLGIRPGYLQYTAKLYKAQVADQGDATLTGNTYSGGAFDINMGFNLYSKKFFVMASFNHIVGKAFRFAPYNTNLATHFDAIVGYNFAFKKKKLELQPSLMLKYVKPASAQLCAMVKITYDNKYWGGLLFRTNDAIGVCLGAKIKDQFSIAYGYDYTLGRLSKFQYGSHEIVLSYIINPKKKSLDEKDEELNNSIMQENKNRMKK